MDIVKWSEDPAEFVANALSPAKVVSVQIHEDEKVARAIVPDYQLSLLRLAKKAKTPVWRRSSRLGKLTSRAKRRQRSSECLAASHRMTRTTRYRHVVR